MRLIKSIGFIVLFLLASFYVIHYSLTNDNYTQLTFDFDPLINYGNFTCHSWQNLSYLNHTNYLECLRWGSDARFWSVQALRHTAHKGLLNSSSLIIEIGGNRGEDTLKFIQLYNASIISYEPLQQMWKDLTILFKNYSKAEFYPFGLGSRARSLLIEPHDRFNEGTSVFRRLSSSNSTKVQRIFLLDVISVIREIQRTRTKNGMIDMLSINCEGCEFEILPALILNDMIRYFRIIQFASHIPLVPDSSCIYCQIEQALARTHVTKYHYRKLWEGWVRRDIADKAVP